MTTNYRLPATLSQDIDAFARKVVAFKNGDYAEADFKPICSAMGVYEQRRDATYMARIRNVGGLISATALKKIIDTALNHGSRRLHITTRQELQIQDISLDDVAPAMRELLTLGLATKGGGGNTVRNILVDEFSGISRDEAFDVTPYALELTSRLIAEVDSYTLPRKLKIALASNEHNVGLSAINDLGLVARKVGKKRGFRVYVGGGAGGRPTTGWLFSDFVPEHEIWALTKGVKQFFAEHGNRENRSQARVRHIFYRLGTEVALRLINDYFQRAKLSAEPFVVTNEVAPHKGRRATDKNTLPDYVIWKHRFVSEQRQAGLHTVLVPIAFGDIHLSDEHAKQWQQLLTLLEGLGADTLRFTTSQNVRLRNIPTRHLSSIYDIIKTWPEVQNPAIIGNIVACNGADTCRLGIAISKDLARDISDELRRSNLALDRLADVAVQIAGCPNSCGQQLWSDVGFAGRKMNGQTAYNVFVAAKRKQSPELAQGVGTLPEKQVPTFVRLLFEDYLMTDENFDFGTYMQRSGKVVAERLVRSLNNQ